MTWREAEGPRAVDVSLASLAISVAMTALSAGLCRSRRFAELQPVYGTTNNPWNRSLTPGGSSGGAAAALAAGLTALEIGSDIGGLIRNPAHYCGAYGHKPTYGIAPPRGQALPGNVAASDISVIGPLARGARDLDWRSPSSPGPTRSTRPAGGSRWRRPAAANSPITASR